MTGEHGQGLGRVAMIAFVFHAPGVRVIAGRRLRAPVVRVNVIAAALTLAAMAAAFVVFDGRPIGGGRACFYAWLIGHFAWSVTLSAWVLRGSALR